MPDSASRNLDVDPVCVKCCSNMHFSCVEPQPNKPGFVYLVYECTKCRTTESFVTPRK